MLRLLKSITWLGVLAAALPSAQAFSLLGPRDAEDWQVQDLGYQLRQDVGGPMNIGEGYRLNTPVLYYAFDESFLGYFGSNGVWAVDQAFAILNSLHNVSDTNYYSADLSQVPLEAKRFNPTAAALRLLDIKSVTLACLVEHMGLADPIRFTWTLHNRTAGAACPEGNEYLVTKRNFAIVPSALDQLQYSSYVNGVLFSYYINEYCSAPPAGAPLSEAVEIPVDVPLNALRYTPIASFDLQNLGVGGFYTGLTRDDVAGLRYLLRSGNVHWEDNPANTVVFVTNAPAGLTYVATTNLALLAAQSLTNDDAALLNLYPGLVIVPNSTIPSFTNLVTTNLTAYYVNGPWDPAGTPPHLEYQTNYDTNVTFVYTRQFANVVTNNYSLTSWVTVIDTNLSFSPWGTYPPVATTNIVTRTMLTNIPTGDFYILPTNSCGMQMLSNILSKPIAVTNSLVVTNFPGSNAVSGTWLLGRTYLTWFTNNNLAYFPVLCVSNQPGLRRGIEKVTFVKTAYDSLLGRFYAPQTNFFTMTTVTNSTNWVQTYQRVASSPDFLFTAADMMPGPAEPLGSSGSNVVREVPRWNQANALTNLAGPGTIDPPTKITFNRSGPIYYNAVTNGQWFLDELTSPRYFLWATYDGSTNAPVIYPNGTSIAAIESQMLMQVTSTTLPPGHANIAYSTQLTGTGGSGPPYIWSLAPGSPLLPAGLTLTLEGQLTGTPAAAGIYSFFVRMEGADGGFTVWQVALTVLP